MNIKASFENNSSIEKNSNLGNIKSSKEKRKIMEISAKTSLDYYNRNFKYKYNKENKSLNRNNHSKGESFKNSDDKKLNTADKNLNSNFVNFNYQLKDIKSEIENTYKRNSPIKKTRINENNSKDNKIIKEKDILFYNLSDKNKYDGLLTMKDSEIQSLLLKNSEMKMEKKLWEKEKNLLEKLIDEIMEKYEINFPLEKKLK